MSRRRSKINDTQDFQEQADRVEQARDAEDSDYHQSTSTPRKRRATNDNDAPRSSKKRSPGHPPYEDLNSDSKKERRAYVRTIRRNWDEDVEQWMPVSIWPCRVTRLIDGRTSRARIENPRDWNAPLLEELSNFSNVTSGQPALALRALETAVQLRQQDENNHAATQVLKEDVRLAMQLHDDAEPGRSSPAHAEDNTEVQEQLDVDMAQDQVEDDQLVVRSPTFAADDAVVRAESQGSGMRNLTENLIGGVWTDFDDEMEKLKMADLEREESEAMAKAKRKEREVIERRRRIREHLKETGDRRQDDVLLRSQ